MSDDAAPAPQIDAERQYQWDGVRRVVKQRYHKKDDDQARQQRSVCEAK
jgi:hypothetical protein